MPGVHDHWLPGGPEHECDDAPKLLDAPPIKSHLDVCHLTEEQKSIVYEIRDSRDPRELIQAFMRGLDTLTLKSFTQVTDQINREWVEDI